MGKVRKKVEQPEFRSSRAKRRNKRKFTGNRFTNRCAGEGETLEGNESETLVNNSSVLFNDSSVNTTIDFNTNNPVNSSEGDVNIPGPSSADGGSHITETITQTVTERKLFTNPVLPNEEAAIDLDGVTELSENEIINMSILSEVIGELLCPECKQSGMKIYDEMRYGLATKCKLFCPCSFESVFWTSPKVDGRAFDINQTMVYALRSIGVGLSGAQTFFSQMNLPPPISCSAYNKIQKKIHNAVENVAIEVMKDAIEEVREVAGVTCEDEIVDSSISCDGTWQRRGFSSLNGAVAILSTDTGKVLDVAPMSLFYHCLTIVSHYDVMSKCRICMHSSYDVMLYVNPLIKGVSGTKQQCTNFGFTPTPMYLKLIATSMTNGKSQAPYP